MSRAPDVVLIHGNGGCTAADFWLPWVAGQLESDGLAVVNQTFPDNVRARASIWLPFLDSLGTDDKTILIGHSSGALAAMRYAETHRLRGSVLVGVCHTDLGDRLEAASGFYREPWRWDAMRANQAWTAVLNSTDDPHIPITEARFVAARLRSHYFEFSDRGHFVESTLPEVPAFVRRMLGIRP